MSKDNNKKFNSDMMNSWHKHHCYYPVRPIVDGKVLDDSVDCLENSIRKVFLLLDERPFEWLDALHVEMSRDWVDFEGHVKFVKLRFVWNDVNVVLYHSHGFEYNGVFNKFFGINPECFSKYVCCFEYNGERMKLDDESKQRIVNDIYVEFSKEIETLHEAFVKKVDEFSKKD